jgi:heme exporter protein A
MLELRDLHAVRGRRRVLTGLNLQVQRGHLLRVTGANGAGKTTLLRLLCGLSQPAAGQVLWSGRPLAAQRDEFHRGLVYVGHGAALKDDLTALENLSASCVLGGALPAPATARAALDAAGLRGRAAAPARTLSQGQRRRVALARLALSADRALWVLDEPFNALDVAATEWLAALVRAQVARGGIVVLTSHQAVPLVEQMTLAL